MTERAANSCLRSSEPGMSDAQFAKDKAAVQNDLKTLKGLLERKSK
jgi:hypothetical protein